MSLILSFILGEMRNYISLSSSRVRTGAVGRSDWAGMSLGMAECLHADAGLFSVLRAFYMILRQIWSVLKSLLLSFLPSTLSAPSCDHRYVPDAGFLSCHSRGTCLGRMDFIAPVSTYKQARRLLAGKERAGDKVVAHGFPACVCRVGGHDLRRVIITGSA